MVIDMIILCYLALSLFELFYLYVQAL